MRKMFRLGGIVLVLVGLLAACGGPQQTTTTAEQPEGSADVTWVRFVNAIPDGDAVDGLVGDMVVATGVGYQQWGEWVEAPAGEQDVAMRLGEAIELSDTYTFEPNRRYWIFAYGMMNPVGAELPASFAIAPEETIEATADDTWMRFVNLAADGENYGLVITTGGSWTLLFPNQAQGTISEYKLGPIYENGFDVIPARDTSLPAVLSFDRNIQVGLIYNFVITGRANNSSLEVIEIAETAVR